MSNWTHVAGIVRIDNIMIPMINPEKLKSVNFWKDMYGQEKVDPYKDAEAALREHFLTAVPTGSEGPMRVYFNIWPRNDDWSTLDLSKEVTKGSMYWADVMFSGDLRNFDEPSKITHWLNQMTETLPDGMRMRTGALYAHSEDGKEIVMFSDGNPWTIKPIYSPEELNDE